MVHEQGANKLLVRSGGGGGQVGWKYLAGEHLKVERRANWMLVEGRGKQAAIVEGDGQTGCW